MITSRPSLPGDRWLFTELREAEVLEGDALGTTSEDTMRIGLLCGGAQTVFFNDKPAAMWGIIDTVTPAIMWAVFTKEIDRHPIAFLRESRRLKDAFAIAVHNYVDARNHAAVAWFKWLGFKVSAPEPYGVNGEMFHLVTNDVELLDEIAVIADGTGERAWA